VAVAAKLTKWEQDAARAAREAWWAQAVVDAEAARVAAAGPAAPDQPEDPDPDPERPALSAPKQEWIDYAEWLGIELTGLETKATIIALVDAELGP
jgi:hypothetical protein